VGLSEDLWGNIFNFWKKDPKKFLDKRENEEDKKKDVPHARGTILAKLLKKKNYKIYKETQVFLLVPKRKVEEENDLKLSTKGHSKCIPRGVSGT